MRTGYQPTTHLSTFPRFRQQLGQNEESLEELESRLERLVKLCGAMVEGGRAWVTQQAQFQVAPLGVLGTSPHPRLASGRSPPTSPRTSRPRPPAPSTR